jgi:hypothetical protein
VLSEYDFFPRASNFHRTEAWEQTWRRNLARAPRRRSPEESQQIKEAMYEWRESSPNERPTLDQLRERFYPPVTKQYLSHLARTLPPRDPWRRRFESGQRMQLAVNALPHSVPSDPDPFAHAQGCPCAGCSAKAEMDAVIRAARGQ